MRHDADFSPRRSEYRYRSEQASDGPFGPHSHDDDGAPRGRGRGPGRGHRHGIGFDGSGFDDAGVGGPGRHGRGRRGPGGRRARGDVRAAILLLLAEQDRHGYELIQEIAERSAGTWTPSPGSIYPTLQALEDEGLLTVEKVEGRRTASLTDAGRAHVAEHGSSLGTPWDIQGGRGQSLTFRRDVMALKDAVAQVARVGTPEQQTAATQVLVEARKSLYRILADDSSSEE